MSYRLPDFCFSWSSGLSSEGRFSNVLLSRSSPPTSVTLHTAGVAFPLAWYFLSPVHLLGDIPGTLSARASLDPYHPQVMTVTGLDRLNQLGCHNGRLLSILTTTPQASTCKHLFRFLRLMSAQVRRGHRTTVNRKPADSISFTTDYKFTGTLVVTLSRPCSLGSRAFSATVRRHWNSLLSSVP